MKQVGAVEVPQEAFLAVLNLDGGQEVSGVRHLYVHLPFCAHRCGYCDFVTVVGRAGQHGAYVDALLAELELEQRRARAAARDRLPRRRDADVHGAAELARLLRALPPAEEVTVEANPETVTPELARLLRTCGVTRVSLGAQSFQPHLLSVLERRAGPDDVRRAVYALRDAGFDNISLDLIYGIPGQSAADLDADLSDALALEPEHLSCYELEAKPGTRFTHAHGEELARQAEAMEAYFERVVERVTAAGYRWYETANFCRQPSLADGRDLRSRHNLAYWRGRDYLGLGIGAVSTIDGAPADDAEARGLPGGARRRLAAAAGAGAASAGGARERAGDARATPGRAARARRARARGRLGGGRAARAARPRAAGATGEPRADRARPLPRRRRHGGAARLKSLQR